MVLEVTLDLSSQPIKEGIEGAKVELINSKGIVVGFDYSDQDGWYQIVYKHIGRPANYTFKATWNGYTFERVVKLTGNEFEEVNAYLDSTGGGGSEDFYIHFVEAITSSKVGKTWNANVKMKVTDQAGTIVANAQVSGNWSTGTAGLCITDITGYRTVSLIKLPLSTLSVTFTVLDIAASGYLYYPTANVGGGVYTVNK